MVTIRENQNANFNVNNIDEETLKKASEKTGIDIEKIKKAASTGNVSELLNNLGKDDSKKVKKLLSNKDAALKFLSTPKAQQLLKKFLGGK